MATADGATSDDRTRGPPRPDADATPASDRGVPLQLTLELGSGVATGHPWLNGEGVLMRLALIDHAGRDYDRWVAGLEDDGPADLRDHPDVDPGLAYTAGVAHASVSQFDVDRTVETTLYSSYDEVLAHRVGGSRPRSKIPIGGGPFKSQMIDVVYRPARRCTFYFRGDRERIDHLLATHLGDIGKKTAAGFGRVLDWGLRTLDADYSLVHPTESVAMRPLPTRVLDRWADEQTLTYVTPYWYTDWAVPCAPPGAAVTPDW